MKKLIAVATLLAIGAVASAQSASSVNAAGFVKKTIDGGDFALVQNPFETFDGSTYTVEDLFGTLPIGSQVFVWNTGSQSFTPITKLTATFWNPPGRTLPRGVGAFVKTPNASGSTDLFLFGEVPGATSHATTEFTLLPGFNAIGNPYPVATTIENSDFQTITSPGDQVAFWRQDTQSYLIVTKLTATFWNPPNTQIPVGTAVFLKVGSQQQLVASVPYSWPNN